MAVQILDASQVLSKLLSKFIELAKIKEMRTEIINFRNMNALKLKITTASDETAEGVLVIPRIKEQSPALSY